MDEFDKRIQSAKQLYEPSPGFVDKTMGEVRKRKVHRRFGFTMWAPALTGFAVIMVVALFFVPKPTQDNIADHKPLPAAKQTSQPSPSASPAAISDGTDNASLEGSLNAVQTSINQSASDQIDTDNAINDTTQQISVLGN